MVGAGRRRGLPARLLGDVAGRRVADLCAAPGGKTAQLALAGADVTAVDIVAKPAEAARRKPRAPAAAGKRLVEADMLKCEPDTLFDAVLLDAPCSSTGTVRRHPDVPWTKSPEDIAKLADLQARLLGARRALVKPGGRIVFSNCSLDPVEGELLVAAFLAEHPDIVLDPVRPGEVPGADPFIAPNGAIRTTPADLDLGRPEISGLDGFFAARFLRLALKLMPVCKRIFALAPRFIQLMYGGVQGPSGGDFWRALRAIPRVCGRWWRASCGDARGAGCAPGRSIAGATAAARPSAC